MIDKAIALIKQFEGCKLIAYLDLRGIWTVGWGHTGPEVCDGYALTQDQADSLLMDRVTKIVAEISAHSEVPLSDNQIAALTSFSYNAGIGAFETSTLLKKINANDLAGAASEFTRWDHVHGKEIEGLLDRRKIERDLFLSA